MTDVGPKNWSTNFDQSVFYDKMGDYNDWSRDYQPGYMFRNLGNEMVTTTNKLNDFSKIIVVHMYNWHLPIIWTIKNNIKVKRIGQKKH